MKRLLTLILLTLLLPCILRAEAGLKDKTDYPTEAAPLARLKANYRQLLIQTASQDSLIAGLMTLEPEAQVSDQMVVELFQQLPITPQRLQLLASTMAPDGSWSDINYQDTLRSGWDPKNHAERILQLAKAYASPQSPDYHSPHLATLLHRALGYWFQTKPRCRNWWYNQIGVPRTLGEALILTEELLTPQERASAIDELSQAQFGMTGQNRVWLAGNVLMRALLQNDTTLVRQARDIIASEIVTGQTEGIKSDWSYHQHGPVLQFGNYGLAFLRSMSQYYGIFAGTPYAFSPEQQQILTQLIQQGFRWTIWHRRMDIGALGRQFFHNAQLHKGYMLALSAQVLGIGQFPLQGNPLVGHKHFYDSDYTIHRTPHWMATLKMSSSRVIGSELINEDNLKGKYMGDGTTFYYVTGREYDNIFPLWQWDRLPGTTTYATPGYEPHTDYIDRWQSNNLSPLVGGITVGHSGLSVMQYHRDGLRANKAYLMTDDYVLCLGNSISSDSSAVVRTTIEQKNHEGTSYQLSQGKWLPLSGITTVQQQQLRLHSGQVGYIIQSPDPCQVSIEQRVGTWHSIMGMYPPADVTGTVFEVTLDHGPHPQQAQYQYIVLPNRTPEQVAQFDTAPILVLQNDAQAQVITIGTTTWVVAYQTVSLPVTRHPAPFTPGIYYLEDGQILQSHLFPEAK